MIGRLRGRVVADEPGGSVVVDVGGVGYELAAPVGTVARAERDEQGLALLYVHTHVREEALDLFGFATAADRKAFRLLIGVPNVGPKTALGLLSVLPIAELALAVDAGDVARLTRVPGIGKKTAERLVLELKQKLTELGPPGVAARAPAGGDDARRLMAALTNMGYRPSEAERALKSLAERVGREPISDLLREALARLTP
jgi:holliday junction DNA helicase RuvA